MADSEYLSNYLQLRRRDQMFVDAMVQFGVGTKAWRTIEPESKRPEVAASKRLARPEIRAAIEERKAEAIAAIGVTHLRTLRELVACAYFNPKSLLNAETGELLPMHEWPDDAAAAIIGCDVEQLFVGKGEARQHVGNVSKPRAAPKVEAIKLLMQYQKMLVEKHEHAGPGGKPLAPPSFHITFPDGGPGCATADDGIETS